MEDLKLKVYRRLTARDAFIDKVKDELARAYAKHGDEPWNRHQFYAILLEEVDELWDDIKADKPLDLMLKELVQVAAMCLRYAETGDMQGVVRDIEVEDDRPPRIPLDGDIEIEDDRPPRIPLP